MVSCGLILPPCIGRYKGCTRRSGEDSASVVAACRKGLAPGPMCLSFKALLSFGAWKRLSGESCHRDHSFQAKSPALLLPLVTLTTHPDGNCSLCWKSCLPCCRTCAPKQLEVFGQRTLAFPQGKSLSPYFSVAATSLAPHPGLGCLAAVALMSLNIPH